jgi:hypothetical protein
LKEKSHISAFCAALSVAVLLAIGQANAYDKPTIAGDWFGRGEPQDKNIFYLDHTKADGTWVSEFERCQGKIAEHHTESGTWRFDNGVEHDIGLLADGHPTHFSFDYAMASNDGQIMSYRVVASDPADPRSIGYLFTARRVSPDFRLPGCLQIS